MYGASGKSEYYYVLTHAKMYDMAGTDRRPFSNHFELSRRLGVEMFLHNSTIRLVLVYFSGKAA